jgi:hypothetical protein
MGNVVNGFDQPKGSGTGNALRLEDTLVTTQATFSIAAGGTNVCEVTINLNDGHGDLIARGVNFNVWLSDAATGLGITGTSASGTVQAKSASGTDLVALVAKKMIIAQPLATGVYILEITDSAKTGFYVAIQNPVTGESIVSRQLATGDYG